MKLSLVTFRMMPLLAAVAVLLFNGAHAALADPLCTPVVHISTPNLVVDQSWQMYRGLPAKWCQCAKPCEPIDREAAIPETEALAEYNAAGDLDLSAAKRMQLEDDGNNLMAQRGSEAQEFRDCLIAQRPVLEGTVEVCAAQTPEEILKENWAKWCKQFDARWNNLYKTYFYPAYKSAAGAHELDVYLQVTTAGEVQVSGKPGGTGVSAVNTKAMVSQINALRMPPIPTGSSWIAKGGYQWQDYSSMLVANGKTQSDSFAKGMPCRGATFTKRDGTSVEIPL